MPTIPQQGTINLIFGLRRAQIGNITVDASVREVHKAGSTVTRNPVEDSADITDHVRLKPLEMTMEGIVTDTPVTFSVLNNITGLIGTATSFFGNSSRSKDAYDNLMRLREAREPIDVVTGLKVYKNMIIEDLTIDRSSTTGKAIHFRAKFVQIEIARSRIASGSAPLSSDVSQIGSAQQDLGNKITDEVAASSPIATGTAVVTEATQETQGAQYLFDLDEIIENAFL